MATFAFRAGLRAGEIEQTRLKSRERAPRRARRAEIADFVEGDEIGLGWRDRHGRRGPGDFFAREALDAGRNHCTFQKVAVMVAGDDCCATT